jgi:hypothetical protein
LAFPANECDREVAKGAKTREEEGKETRRTEGSKLPAFPSRPLRVLRVFAVAFAGTAKSFGSAVAAPSPVSA